MFREKFGRVCLKVAGTLIAIEVTLQVTGVVYQQISRAQRVQPAMPPGQGITILCVGDSHTWGHGAGSPEAAYPAQLEQRFNAGTIDRVQVVNLGIPGQNSSQLVRRLEQQIATYHPAAILVLVGINNYWNFAELNVPNRSLMTGLRSAAARLKLYKLMTLVIQQARQYSEGASAVHRTKQQPAVTTAETLSTPRVSGQDDAMSVGWEAIRQGHYPLALEQFQRARQMGPDDPAVYYGLGKTYLHLGIPQEAIKALLQCKALDSSHPGLYTALGESYREAYDYQHSLEAFQAGIAQEPTSAWPHRMLADLYLRYVSADPSLGERAKEELERAFELDHNFEETVTGLIRCYPDLAQLLQALDRLFQEKWYTLTRAERERLAVLRRLFIAARDSQDRALRLLDAVLIHDLRQVAEISDSRQVPVFFMTYALHLASNPVIRAALHEAPGSRLIDLEPSFDEAIDSSPTRLFTVDQHPNATGYALMADIIFQRLIADGALNAPSAEEVKHGS